MNLAGKGAAHRVAVALASLLVGVSIASTGYAAAAQKATRATGGAYGEPLAGTWAGELTGQASSGAHNSRIVIVVNQSETGGSWKLSATCRGPLSLQSISGGYHHYLRRVVPGASCTAGDVDCLRQEGANTYDAVTSHLGGAYDLSGTLRRVRPR